MPELNPAPLPSVRRPCQPVAYHAALLIKIKDFTLWIKLMKYFATLFLFIEMRLYMIIVAARKPSLYFHHWIKDWSNLKTMTLCGCTYLSVRVVLDVMSAWRDSIAQFPRRVLQGRCVNYALKALIMNKAATESPAEDRRPSVRMRYPYQVGCFQNKKIKKR